MNEHYAITMENLANERLRKIQELEQAAKIIEAELDYVIGRRESLASKTQSTISEVSKMGCHDISAAKHLLARAR